MATEITLDASLTAALNAAIQPKLVEVGWSTGGNDDSALAEYIILMLMNGKTQDQIAAELSGDLLNLGPDDPGAKDFSKWLFEQVEILSRQANGQGTEATEESGQSHSAHGGQDAEMGDAPESADGKIPTGPKSMRNGADRNRDKRMFNQLGKAMDRSQDSVLHRVRPQGGNERINTHARGPPTGPRNIQGRGGRTAMGRPNQGMNIMGGANAGVPLMSPQQQMELFQMLEQQSKMMANMFSPQQQQMMNGGNMTNQFGQQQTGKSLFDRVQRNRNHQNGGGFKKSGQANGAKADNQSQSTDQSVSAMDMELTPLNEPQSADNICKFNLGCTNKDCKFAHQSPAAPAGTTIDVKDICSFGAACKNRKCTARHPSPAQKIAHQTEQDCKFFPNCTNPHCPFRHPSMPLCRNGADCTTPNCKFTHVKTLCKFNPCLNPSCMFKHEEGQKRGKFDDKVWIAPDKEHVSERKFVDENQAEELIKPEGNEATTNAEIVA